LIYTPPGRSAPTLRGIQFSLQPGSLLAVLGTSGSGKSTLARLLVGIHAATQGKVRLDGSDVYPWNKAELGPYIGYVGQSVELIEGTLAENIARFGDPDAGRLAAAAQAVGIADWIATLPLGFDTPVGIDGMHFSGGQRQRIALARALYGDPVWVVLDEPNAHLDEAGDAQLNRTLQALRARGATVVLMTHRPGALALADRILVLRDGVQQAFGPRDDVLGLLRQATVVPLAEGGHA
jgi:ATP-binding cassette subfamily C exporter for protease/lipase